MSKNYRIYKPNNQGTGAASEWQLSFKPEEKFDNVMLFLGATKQVPGKDSNDNQQFAWKDKSQCITMKLGELDCGEILAVLNGLKDKAGSEKGIFHQNAKGNTVLSFSKYVNKEGVFVGYGLRLSKKNKDEADSLLIQHLLSVAEGEILRVLINKALEAFYAWDIWSLKAGAKKDR